MGPFLRYTALRLAVLVGVGGVLWLAGLRGLLWALVSVLVAAALSYVLLARPRDELLARWSSGRGGAPRSAAGSRRLRQAGRAGDGVSDEDAEDARVEAAERERRPGT